MVVLVSKKRSVIHLRIRSRQLMVASLSVFSLCQPETDHQLETEPGGQNPVHSSRGSGSLLPQSWPRWPSLVAESRSETSHPAATWRNRQPSEFSAAPRIRPEGWWSSTSESGAQRFSVRSSLISVGPPGGANLRLKLSRIPNSWLKTWAKCATLNFLLQKVYRFWWQLLNFTWILLEVQGEYFY